MPADISTLPGLLELSENLPVRIEIIDSAEGIEPLLATLETMIGEGLLTITDVHIRKYVHWAKGVKDSHVTEACIFQVQKNALAAK